jgi:REP element-mobilizing transposase RayT
VARRLREEVEGGIFHVFARGNRKQAIYLDDEDRHTYLRMLGAVVAKRNWCCLAYCLMPNHVHLLVETPGANLGIGMQWLHGLYAQTFNERHGRSGHLFQGRYGSVRVTTDAQLWMLVRYLAVNPVRAELCARPANWRWSSHGALAGSSDPGWLDHSRLLQYFAASGGDPAERYSAMVADDYRCGGSESAARVRHTGE